MPPAEFQTDPARPSPGRIVLVHGAGYDGSVWDLQTEALSAEGFQVFAPDLPGHGACTGPALTDIESMAAWLVDRLRADSSGATAIAGHSMGSLIALEACARAPELFASLILVGTACPMPVAPNLLQAAMLEPGKAHALINRWSFAPSAGEPDPAGPLRIANLELMQRQPPGVLARDLNACNIYANGAEAAARISCPSTLICGELDRMTPLKTAVALRDALARDRSNVAIITLEGAGHSMMSEQPVALTHAIRESIARPH